MTRTTSFRLITSTSAFDSHQSRLTPASKSEAFNLHESPTDWREAVDAQLEELIRLSDGWDGYGGVPVTFQNACFALEVLKSICLRNTEAPQIVPGPDGDLQLEWHTHYGDLELHIQSPNKVHASLERAGAGLDEERDLTNDFAIAAEWLKEITEPPIAVRTAAA